LQAAARITGGPFSRFPASEKNLSFTARMEKSRGAASAPFLICTLYYVEALA